MLLKTYIVTPNHYIISCNPVSTKENEIETIKSDIMIRFHGVSEMVVMGSDNGRDDAEFHIPANILRQSFIYFKVFK